MNAWEWALVAVVVWCLVSNAVAGLYHAYQYRACPGFDPDVPQALDYDPFSAFLANEVSLAHLRAAGVREEQIREHRQELDAQLMRLHEVYRELGLRQGHNPPELYGWGTETFRSTT